MELNSRESNCNCEIVGVQIAKIDKSIASYVLTRPSGCFPISSLVSQMNSAKIFFSNSTRWKDQ